MKNETQNYYLDSNLNIWSKRNDCNLTTIAFFLKLALNGYIYIYIYDP